MLSLRDDATFHICRDWFFRIKKLKEEYFVMMDPMHFHQSKAIDIYIRSLEAAVDFFEVVVYALPIS